MRPFTDRYGNLLALGLIVALQACEKPATKPSASRPFPFICFSNKSAARPLLSPVIRVLLACMEVPCVGNQVSTPIFFLSEARWRCRHLVGIGVGELARYRVVPELTD